MTEEMLRGSKIRIFPNKRQTGLLDVWRRRTISLWNLLLELEQAAYSGEQRRPELRWRSILVDIAHENYKRDLHLWDHGREGKRARKPGHLLLEDYEADLAAYPEIRARWRQDVRNWKEAGQVGPKPKEPLKPKKPQKPTPPDKTWIAKIYNGRDGTVYYPDDKESEFPERAFQPRLFIWKRELQNLLARLKHVPRSAWIADLSSHSAQAVVKDLAKALTKMLSERHKRASGGDGRKVGFPKFKKFGISAGSVYFANTQLQFDFENQKVRLPNGCGWIRCELPRELREKALKDSSCVKPMGGRIWRQGNYWYLSVQWELKAAIILKKTGRTAGVKLGATVLLTTYDDRGQTREYIMPPVEKTLARRHLLAGRRLARAIEKGKKKKKKIEASGYSRRREQRLAASGKQSKPLRIRRTPGFFHASADLARYEAIDADRRNGFIHRVTTDIVREFDAIAVQRYDVADLMKKEKPKKKKPHTAHAERTRENTGDTNEESKQAWKKPVRKLMRRAAISRCGDVLVYKFKELRGEGALHDIDPYHVNANACSSCGAIHPEWKDVQGILHCQEILADGRVCGNALPRNRNSARLSKRELDAHIRDLTKESDENPGEGT